MATLLLSTKSQNMHRLTAMEISRQQAQIEVVGIKWVKNKRSNKKCHHTFVASTIWSIMESFFRSTATCTVKRVGTERDKKGTETHPTPPP